MAIYETIHPSETPAETNIAVKEIPIYGSTRLGQYRPFKDELGQVNKDLKTALGQRIYEFSNHLGNVLVTLTDNKVPNQDGTYKAIVLSASDYYPFGMAMKERTYSNSEYRYGFNGKENDTDFGSHIQDYGFRLYSAAEARFLSVDPLTKGYSMLTPYQFASNSPITNIDLDGLEAKDSKKSEEVIGTIPRPATEPDVNIQTLVTHNYTHGQVLINPDGDGKDYQVTKITPKKIEYYFEDRNGNQTVLVSPSLQQHRSFSRVYLADLHDDDRKAIDRPVINKSYVRDLEVKQRAVSYEIELTELQPVMEQVETTTYRTGKFGVIFQTNSATPMTVTPNYMATLGTMKSDTQDIVTITGNYDSSKGETQNLATQRAIVTENLFQAANPNIQTQIQTQDSNNSDTVIEIIIESKSTKTKNNGSYWNLQKNNSSDGN